MTPDLCFKGRGWEEEGAPRKIIGAPALKFVPLH